MKHIKAMAIKFISNLVLLYIILGLIFDVSFGNVFLISLVLSVAAYILGDLMVLPRTNNLVATMADFGLAFLIIWFMVETLTVGDNTVYPSLIASIGVALFEYMFHKYMANNILDNKEQSGRVGGLQYQTEASEELTPVRPDVRNSDDTNKK